MTDVINPTAFSLSSSLKENKISYVLHLADNALIFTQQQAAWCGHGPALEQDIAITNISLDLLGQARNLYQYAATLINALNNLPTNNITEDSLAYLRTEREFKNCLLCEQPNGDWAQSILKLFLFSQYQYLLFTELINIEDEQLSAIAQKSLKETTYHLRWSSEWVIRLGDGTAESQQRMQNAINTLWPYTGELFSADEYELPLGINYLSLKKNWIEKVKIIFNQATVFFTENTFMQTGGKQGVHTENLGFILAEMQYLQRVYPNCQW